MAWWKRSSPLRGWGTLLLAVWLIVTGVFQLFPQVAFAGSGTLLGVLAILAGVDLFMER